MWDEIKKLFKEKWFLIGWCLGLTVFTMPILLGCRVVMAATLNLYVCLFLGFIAGLSLLSLKEEFNYKLALMAIGGITGIWGAHLLLAIVFFLSTISDGINLKMTIFSLMVISACTIIITFAGLAVGLLLASIISKFTKK